MDAFFASNRVKESEIRLSPEVTAVNQLLSSIPDRIVLPETITKMNELKEQLDSLIGADITRYVLVSDLLEAGREILHENGDERCPLCGQNIDLDALLIELDERARQVKASREKFDSIILMASTVSKELSCAISRLEGLLREGRRHRAFLKWAQRLETAGRTLSEYKEALDTIEQGPIPLILDDLMATDAVLRATLSEIRESTHALVQKIAPSTEELYRYETLVLVGEVIEKARVIGRSEEEAARLARAYEVSDKIFRTYIDCKHEVVQGVYDSIQADIARFYSMLHPGEQPNNISLEVDKSKRASADLRIDYFDRTNDPRAYLSEGHLDSLGLCILLAFVKKYGRNCPIIILDDIVTTIDAGHRGRICELVYSEFKGAQVFITTHDGIWKEQLVNYDRAYSVNLMFLEIVGYSPTLGPVIQQARTSWEMIMRRLTEGDKGGAGNEGRRYLEEVLEDICVLLRASITYKGSSYRYNVQELLDAARKRAETKIDKSYFDSEILPKFLALSSNKFLANMASHRNAELSEVSIDEIKGFCEAVRTLDAAFSCNSCGKRLCYSDEYKKLHCINPNCDHQLRIRLR